MRRGKPNRLSQRPPFSVRASGHHSLVMRDQSPVSAAVTSADRRRRAAPSGRTPSRSYAAARRTHLIQAIRDAARRRKLEAEQLVDDKPARERCHRAMIALQAAANHVEQLPDADPDLVWLHHQRAHHGRLILSQGAVDLLGLCSVSTTAAGSREHPARPTSAPCCAASPQRKPRRDEPLNDATPSDRRLTIGLRQEIAHRPTLEIVADGSDGKHSRPRTAVRRRRSRRSPLAEGLTRHVVNPRDLEREGHHTL